MSQRKFKVFHQEGSRHGSDQSSENRHKPFLVRLATSEELAQKITICKKCENVIRRANDANTIHSTLAYSRCRCHRVFKYKDNQQRLIDCGGKVALLEENENNDSHIFSQNRQQLDLQEAAEKNYNALSSAESKHKVYKDGELSGGRKGVENGVRTLPVATPHNYQDDLDSPFSLVGGSITCKVPHVERHKIKRKPVSSPLLLMRKERRSHPISSLIDLVKYVDQSKKQKMKEIFGMIDKDGDGHILYVEFLKCLPKTALYYDCILKEFYVSLNALTYFGFHEFILCFEIAERLSRLLHDLSNSNFQQCDLQVGAGFLEDVLSPFMKYISMATSEGEVTMDDIEGTVTKMNKDLNDSVSIVPISKMSLFDKDKTMHILDCLALSPFFLQKS